VPFRAIGLVSATVIVLSLINIASTTALTAMFALTTISLYISYIIPIVCLLIKRFRNEPITFGPWNLGRYGLAVNLYAVIYGTFIVIFVPFPPYLPVSLENMNYCAPVFLVVLLLLLLDWSVRGRNKFKGPLNELLHPTPDYRSRRNS